MEQNRDEEISKLKRLLVDLEDKNNKMYYELRELNVKLNNLMNAPKSNIVSEKIVEEIKPVVEVPEVINIEPEAIKSEEIPVSIPEPTRIEAQKPLVAEIKTPSQEVPKSIQKPISSPPKASKTKQEWERFIGENLINKIGILITVIGVAIGTKYAIDKELLTPAMRIALGYAVGAGLLLFALKLKAKYLDFSAVLLSGAMAIFYFVTYISFSFYHFFPVSLTFLLMVVFTGFTVFSAIKYDRQVIAHIGLVGAYAVPFLLSDGSGRIGFFYSYIAVVNIGILIISFIRNWKPLKYVSYGFTWLIFFSWFFISYEAKTHFNLAILFLFVFFLIFYLTGLAYKVLKHEKFNVSDVFFILGNSFIFFGLGYSIISTRPELDSYLGVFCVFNAVVHFIVSIVLYRNKLVDKTIFYLTTGMVLLFVTITIPIQFDGDVITITWTFEALMLFLVGRIKKINLFEWMSYPVFIVASISLGFFWIQNYGKPLLQNNFLSFYHKYDDAEVLKISDSLKNTFLFNMRFFSTFCLVLASGIMFYFNNVKAKIESLSDATSLQKSFNVLSIIILLLSLFVGVFLEINHFWEIKTLAYQLGIIETESKFDQFDFQILKAFAHVSKIAYVLIFFGLLQFMRAKKQNSIEFKYVLFIISSIAIFIFLSFGIYQMRNLKFMYLNAEHSNFAGYGFIALRLGLYAIFAGFIYAFVRFIKKQMPSLFVTNFSSILILSVSFICIFMEIQLFWEVKELAFRITSMKENHSIDYSVLHMMQSFGILCKIAFSLIFFGIISYFNTKKEKTIAFKTLIFVTSLISILVFLLLGIANFRYLEINFTHIKSEYYSGFSVVFIRYLMYFLFGGFIYAFVRFLKAQMKAPIISNFILFMVHLVIFFCVFMEINLYWEMKEIAFRTMCRKELHRLDSYNLSLLHSFALISKIAFSIIFFGVTLFLRNKKENSLEFKTFVFTASTLIILLFLVLGLYNFSFLQLNYLHSKNEYFSPMSLVLVRYLMYGLFTVYMFNYIQFIKKQFNTKFFLGFAEFMMHISLLWIVSSELVDWMHVFNSKQVYKLALSILWGIYSLGLIAYGIWKKKSHLRIGAISLFAVTLIKLFVYDLQHMSTISKTIVFIALGILLLIISFLYNKYKSILFEENEK